MFCLRRFLFAIFFFVKTFLFCCGCGGGDVTFSYCYVVFKYLFKKYINLHGLKFLCFCFSVVFLLFMTIN